eukprot:TRINITY_DN28000_c0_g1_i1.p1 TRINITY_DN28000_c0_g1~~TRINITY_DN28000_c0_g1_i1.p1  ORF type:complete len:237 (+),score=29.03 TRINITY_DN28000_c0_g1_i1:85-795(+)
MVGTTTPAGMEPAIDSLTSVHPRLCIRNIPCKILEANFEETMHALGLDASRYKLQFPKRRSPNGRLNNFGYGFIICSQTHDAEAFTRAFQGYCFEGVRSSKRLQIEPALQSVHSAVFSTSSSSTTVKSDVEMLTNDAAASSTREVASAFPNMAAGRVGSEAVCTSTDMLVAEPLGALSSPFESPSSDSANLHLSIPNACELPSTRLAAVGAPRVSFADGMGGAWRSDSARMAFRFK